MSFEDLQRIGIEISGLDSGPHIPAPQGEIDLTHSYFGMSGFPQAYCPSEPWSTLTRHLDPRSVLVLGGSLGASTVFAVLISLIVYRWSKQ